MQVGAVHVAARPHLGAPGRVGGQRDAPLLRRPGLAGRADSAPPRQQRLLARVERACRGTLLPSPTCTRDSTHPFGSWLLCRGYGKAVHILGDCHKSRCQIVPAKNLAPPWV